KCGFGSASGALDGQHLSGFLLRERSGKHFVVIEFVNFLRYGFNLVLRSTIGTGQRCGSRIVKQIRAASAAGKFLLRHLDRSRCSAGTGKIAAAIDWEG